MTKVRAYLISTLLNDIDTPHINRPSDIMHKLKDSDNIMDLLIKSNFDRVARIAQKVE